MASVLLSGVGIKDLESVYVVYIQRAAQCIGRGNTLSEVRVAW